MTEQPFARYLAPLRQWWPIFVGVVAAAVLLAWVTAPEPTVRVEGQPGPDQAYRATHILVRGEPIPATEELELVALLAEEGEIPQRVSEEFDGFVEPNSIAAVDVQPDSDLGTLSVTSVQPTASMAGRVATAYAEAIRDHFDERAAAGREDQVERITARLVALDARIQELSTQTTGLLEDSLEFRILDSEIKVLVDQYATLRGELNILNGDVFGTTFSTLQEPAPVAITLDDGGIPEVFSIPEARSVRVLLALLVSAALGLGLVIAIDRVDNRIRTREDAESAFGLPVVTEVPRIGRRRRRSDPLPTHSDPGGNLAEAYRSMRVAVQLTSRWRLQRDSPTAGAAIGSAAPVSHRGTPRTVMVTSAGEGAGKSNVVANLAASMAESGERVLVIDVDFRRPSVHRLFDVHGDQTLHDLQERSADALRMVAQETAVPGVSLIRAGSRGHAPPWFLTQGGHLVEMAQELADVVIFDTGPLLGTNEAAALSPHVEAVLVVARTGRTTTEEAHDTTEQLTRLRAMVAGIVLVGSAGSARHSSYEPLRRAAAAQKAMTSSQPPR